MRGYPVVHELAREVIEEGVLLPWVDPVEFRREVCNRQLAAEGAKRSEQRQVFLDRGAYDGTVYCYATGCAVPSFLADLPTQRYKTVFVLEPLPSWVDDGLRYENAAFAQLIHPLFVGEYRNSGARVFEVPVLPVKDRVDWILARLSDLPNEN